MSTYLLHCGRVSETASRLASFLGVPNGRFSGRSWDNVIRYGSTTPVHANVREVNKLKSVVSASDKLLSLRMLSSAGISCPEHFEDPTSRKIQFPLLGRLSSGMRGEDIVVFFQNRDMVECCKNRHFDLFTKYIPKKEEYRVHVIGGKIAKAAYKEFRGDPNKQHGFRSLVWNKKNGFFFKKVLVRDCPETAKSLAASTVSCLGLDFGAVDIILGDDGGWYVLEVNTAPGLSRVALSVYGKKLAEMCGISGYPGMSAVNFPETEEED